jgi:hypothetical protein
MYVRQHLVAGFLENKRSKRVSNSLLAVALCRIFGRFRGAIGRQHLKSGIGTDDRAEVIVLDSGLHKVIQIIRVHILIFHLLSWLGNP